MPRLSTQLLLRAYQRNPLLAILLRECRSLGSAENELRWLHERAMSNCPHDENPISRLRSLCLQRSRGRPLQYILGDQPFGDLTILCRMGVLIPRPETELYTFHTAKLILDQLQSDRKLTSTSQPRSFRVIDLCTGTGCISLLLHALLAPHIEQLTILGLDLSKLAVSLARRNTIYNVQRGVLSTRALTDIVFEQADVLTLGGDSSTDATGFLRNFTSQARVAQLPSVTEKFDCNILISNPPYISRSSIMDGTTARSVHRYEPMIALVPPLDHAKLSVRSSRRRVCTVTDADLFYPRLLAFSNSIGANITVLECGDIVQARRVVNMAKSTLADNADAVIDIWPHDEGDSFDGARAVIIQRPSEH